MESEISFMETHCSSVDEPILFTESAIPVYGAAYLAVGVTRDIKAPLYIIDELS